MLTERDLSAIQNIEPNLNELLILDLRQPKPDLYRLFRRACRLSGTQTEALTFTELDELALYTTDSLIVLYTDPETGKQWKPKLTGLSKFKLIWLRDETVHFSLSGSPILAADLHAKAWSTAIQVEGLNTLGVHEVNLPLNLKLQIPVSKRYRNIHIQGENDFQDLPVPAWFRLPPGLSEGEIELELSIQVQSENSSLSDQWQVTVRNTGQSLPQMQQPQARIPLQNNRLAIVFDRTCPDPDAWSAARQVLQTGKVPEPLIPSGFYNQVSDRTCQVSDLNRNLRRSLIQGLQQFYRDKRPDIQIDLAWFADTHQPHLAQPRHLTLPLSEAGSDLSLRLADLDSALDALTYSPGLDIWDPVEAALEKLVARFESQDFWAPVVIIGNSPPNPPELFPESPYLELLQSTHTTIRRPWTMGSGRSFAELVRLLEKQGMPVFYLFLHGFRTVTGDERENRAFQAFKSHQEMVERLLTHFVQVESCTFSGMQASLEQVLTNLELPRYSAVKFLQMQEHEASV